MVTAVNKPRHSPEIVRVIVERIFVPMMDLIPLRYRPVNSLIHHPV